MGVQLIAKNTTMPRECIDEKCSPPPPPKKKEPCDLCVPVPELKCRFEENCDKPRKQDYIIESGFNSLWKYDNVIGAEKGDGKGVPEPKEAPTKDGKLTVEVEGGMIGPIPNGKVKLTYETPAPGCDLVIPKE